MTSGAGRYAPSPSGPLHLGNLRTALLAWLAARARHAPFVLRIDDLDQSRCRPQHEVQQLADLDALGITFDGPVLRQSTRHDRYAEALAELTAQGLVYPCWCTRAEVRAAASAPHGPQTHRYPGTCRDLTAAERARREASGRLAALRVHAGGATVAFTDQHRGAQAGVVDDVVLRRGDGTYAYHLATVIDDHDQGVGEVVRGEDLLDATPTQIWLIAQLRLRRPTYAHVPLVLNNEGRRLAKRDGAVTLTDRQALGDTPAHIVGMLAASVGLAPPGAALTLDRLLERYDPATFTPPPSGPLPS